MSDSFASTPPYATSETASEPTHEEAGGCGVDESLSGRNHTVARTSEDATPVPQTDSLNLEVCA